MKKRLDRLNLQSQARVNSLWATSYTLDEAEFYRLVFHTMGRFSQSAQVHLTCDRSGFKRTPAVIVPRKWINFRPKPKNAKLLATYHPKLVLLSADKSQRLIVSSANITPTDQRRQRNLAFELLLNNTQARTVRHWIKNPKGKQTLVAIVPPRGGVRVPPPDNRPTIDHFRDHILLQRCRHSSLRKNWWIVAAPFWSPVFLQRLIDIHAGGEADGKIEAYFRDEHQWGACRKHLKAASRVAAYRLLENGTYPPWHHKLLAWRCCDSSRAKAVVYVGSANATVSGILGQKGQAINWEAGAVFIGGAELWEHARSAARAEMRAEYLPAGSSSEFEEDEVIGPQSEADDQINERLSQHLEQHVLVRRPNQVKLCSKKIKPIRILGSEWEVNKASLLTGKGKELQLGSSQWSRVAKNSLATIRAEYISDKSKRWTIHLDLPELDPEPPHFEISAGEAAHQFRQLLQQDTRESDGKTRKSINASFEDVISPQHLDIRFPFREALCGLQDYPERTTHHLKGLLSAKDEIGQRAPAFWKMIASALLSASP